MIALIISLKLACFISGSEFSLGNHSAIVYTMSLDNITSDELQERDILHWPEPSEDSSLLDTEFIMRQKYIKSNENGISVSKIIQR